MAIDLSKASYCQRALVDRDLAKARNFKNANNKAEPVALTA